VLLFPSSSFLPLFFDLYLSFFFYFSTLLALFFSRVFHLCFLKKVNLVKISTHIKKNDVQRKEKHGQLNNTDNNKNKNDKLKRII